MNDLRKLIDNARTKVAATVNSATALMYWHIGERINREVLGNEPANLEDVHLAQAKNYVVAYNFEKGLLINFGATSLRYKLVFNSKTNSANSTIL